MATRIKFPSGRFYKLRSEPGVQSFLEKQAEQIAARANRMSGMDGYKTSSVQGKRKPFGRWRTTVITANRQAMRDNAKNQTLTKAIGGG